LIFRSEALEHYIQSKEKNILPRITTPPVFLCLWILLALCISAFMITYLSQMPIYSNGSGIVLEHDATVLVFLPTSSARPVHILTGAPVFLHIGTPTQTIQSTIDHVETGVLSPSEALKRYGLETKMPQIISGPTIVASVKLSTAFPLSSYAGSVVSVQVQIGTTRVFSLLLSSAVLNGE
jgi:hypothetical protein